MQFDPLKAIQASAVLLKHHADRMSRLRLLKLLYIADREAIAETLNPIIADRVTAMDNGPVLSRTYDMLKGQDFESPRWDEFITKEGPRDLLLSADPGVGRLSKYEIQKLTEVSERYWFQDDYEVVEVTHRFDEWIKNKPPARGIGTIPFDDILAALNLSDYSRRIKDEANAEAELDQLFQS